MNLATLKTKLSIKTGTNIGEVLFDWKEILNTNRAKTYPIVLWVFDGSKASGDMRSSTIQVSDTFSFTVFAIVNARPDLSIDEKITLWDTLRSDFKTYLNAMNNDSAIEISNINNIKWEYVPERMISADNEIGLMFTEITVKTFCNA